MPAPGVHEVDQLSTRGAYHGIYYGAARAQAMKARFSSQCSACGDVIKQGREISRDSSDKWVHKHCVDEAGEALP